MRKNILCPLAVVTVILAQFCVDQSTAQAESSDCAEKLARSGKEVTLFVQHEPFALYKLGGHSALPDSEPLPGGMFALVREPCAILWSRRFSDDPMFSSNGQYVTLAEGMQFETNTVPTVIDATTGKNVLKLRYSKAKIYSIDVARNGNTIAAGTQDGTVLVFDRFGEMVFSYHTSVDIFVDVAISNDDQYLLDSVKNKLFTLDGRKVIGDKQIVGEVVFDRKAPCQGGCSTFRFVKSQRILVFDHVLNRLFDHSATNPGGRS